MIDDAEGEGDDEKTCLDIINQGKQSMENY